jgi:hypothetical protein
MDVGGGEGGGASTGPAGGVGASAGSGVGESNTRSGETDIESRVSIIAMQVGRAYINCH